MQGLEKKAEHRLHTTPDMSPPHSLAPQELANALTPLRVCMCVGSMFILVVLIYEWNIIYNTIITQSVHKLNSSHPQNHCVKLSGRIINNKLKQAYTMRLIVVWCG